MAGIGVVAVEDDGIYFTVAEASRAGIGDIPIPNSIPRPENGYDADFITRECVHFCNSVRRTADVVAISMFGQVNSNEGTLLDVPRQEWRGGPFKEPLDFQKLFPNLPIFLSNDASAAALGEWLYRYRMQPHEPELPKLFTRIRVGSGIGVGFIDRNGDVTSTPQDWSNPEAGHLPVYRGGGPRGTCRRHSGPEWDCIEGMISEPAVRRRCGGAALEDIPDDDPVWDSVSRYLAVLCIAVKTMTLADEIVIGGRTMIDRQGQPREALLARVHATYEEMTGNYPSYTAKAARAETYILPSDAVPNPAWVSVIGAAELARRWLFQ